MSFDSNHIKLGVRTFLTAPLVLAASLFVGCREPEVLVHQYPAEEFRPHSGGAPWLVWDLPEGWSEAEAGSMRYASFQTVDANQRSTDVSVTTFTGQVGSDLDNVNRWRRQVGLFPVDETELARGIQSTPVAGKTGLLVDMEGQSPESGARTRILGVIADGEGGRKWYFKMTGTPEAIAGQEGHFRSFLESLRMEPPLGFSSVEESIEFQAAQGGDEAVGPMMSGMGMPAPQAPRPAPSRPAPSGAPSTEGLPKWTAPAEWEQVQASSMAKASFSTQSGAQLAISEWPGDVGGIFANINRWRGQVGLSGFAESELSSYVREIDINGTKASVMDTHGAAGNRELGSTPERILSVWLPRDGKTWIFKMRGPSAEVLQEEDRLIEFVRSIQF